MNHLIASLLLFCAISFVALRPAPAVTIEWSPVGNAGNAADPVTGSLYGAVGYDYNIGTKDVTNRQYAEFLNTKDSSGTNSLLLWNSSMADATFGGISLNGGNPAGSRYVLAAGREEHPVNYVTWYDAIRFANWLNNGQGSGDTETGAYTLLGGGPTPTNGLSITRNAGARVFLPSEDEWYKAAYYDPDTSSYFQYATSSNLTPIASGPTSLANHANYDQVVGNLTDVGVYSGTTSPYGAFDMNGNAFQWNEALIFGDSRQLRGGSWNFSSGSLQRGSFLAYPPTTGGHDFGFRVASIPEPSTLLLGALGTVGLLLWRRVRRKPISLLRQSMPACAS
jgi:formylglycine-generating enzyme required for sulfatase activity